MYVGKGKWVVDDPSKYASRDGWFTGGWPGGEVGLKERFNKEAFVAPGDSGMVPAGDARRGAGIASGDGNASTAASASADPAPDTPDALDAPSAPSEPRPRSSAAVDKVKFALLKALAPLDRGVAASDADRDSVRSLAETLETLASANPSSFAPVDDALERALEGEWRLAYSSTFAGEQPGSQGFTGAPGGGGAPLGAVYQRFDREKKTCDNVVSLGLAKSPLFGAASLGHSYVITGRTARITFTGVTVESNPFGLPAFTLPSPLDALPKEARDAARNAGGGSGAFDVTFVDADARVSRGDRGELRVFVR